MSDYFESGDAVKRVRMKLTLHAHKMELQIKKIRQNLRLVRK